MSDLSSPPVPLWNRVISAGGPGSLLDRRGCMDGRQEEGASYILRLTTVTMRKYSVEPEDRIHPGVGQEQVIKSLRRDRSGERP
jgi:hypothetical protein